jgi:hypothetical protein
MNAGYMTALRCLLAVIAIRRERGQDVEIKTDRVTAWHWSGAVIVLADDHTPQEEAEALRTLSSEGLNWYEIAKRAETTEARMLQEVPA